LFYYSYVPDFLRDICFLLLECPFSFKFLFLFLCLSFIMSMFFFLYLIAHSCNNYFKSLYSIIILVFLGLAFVDWESQFWEYTHTHTHTHTHTQFLFWVILDCFWKLWMLYWRNSGFWHIGLTDFLEGKLCLLGGTLNLSSVSHFPLLVWLSAICLAVPCSLVSVRDFSRV
jgi:hypothetical protein